MNPLSALTGLEMGKTYSSSWVHEYHEPPPVIASVVLMFVLFRSDYICNYQPGSLNPKAAN